MTASDARNTHLSAVAANRHEAPEEDLDWVRIRWLLDRLDPQASGPVGVPGEIVLSAGRGSLADAA